MGPFVIVPEWLIDAAVSARALQLYSVIATYADHTTGMAYPGRKALANRCGVSEDTIDRRKAELVEVGALKIEHVRSDDGMRSHCIYTVIQLPPPNHVATRPRSPHQCGVGGPREYGIGSRTSADLTRPINKRTSSAKRFAEKEGRTAKPGKDLDAQIEAALAIETDPNWRRKLLASVGTGAQLVLDAWLDRELLVQVDDERNSQ